MVREKFEEFFLWLEDNWESCTGATQSGISKEDFFRAGYGVKRLRGLLDFMDKEDWSERMPELREWVQLLDQRRGLSFKDTFPEMSRLLDEE